MLERVGMAVGGEEGATGYQQEAEEDIIALGGIMGRVGTKGRTIGTHQKRGWYQASVCCNWLS